MRLLVITLFLCVATAAYGGWRVRISSLPNFVYADETRLITVDVACDNLTNTILQIHVQPENRVIPFKVSPHGTLNGNMQTKSHPAISTGMAIVPIRISADVVHSPVSLTLNVVAADDGTRLATERYVLAVGASTVMSVRRQEGHYYDDAGHRVVWINTLRSWQERRKWVLPRRAARLYHRRNGTVQWLGSAADRVSPIATATNYYARLDGMQSGVPLESILDLPLLLRNPPPRDWGTPNLVVSLPAADMHARRSREDIVRAIDLASRWLRDRYGEAASLVLLTPFPWPGQCDLTEAFADAIREAGRHAELPVIDVHAAMLGLGTWESLYTADGAIFYDSPLQDGQDLAARLIADVFPQLHQRPLERPPITALPNHGQTPPSKSESPDIQWRSVDVGTAQLSCEFPGEASQWGMPSVAATGVNALALDVTLPHGAPADIAASLRMKDKDGLWFQAVSALPLTPGRTNRLVFPVGDSTALIAGGSAVWDDYHRRRMQEVGLGLFSGADWTGLATVVRAAVRTETHPSQPPRILRFRGPPTDAVCTGRYELAFILDNTTDLNPFDPDEIEVKVLFESPSGSRTSIDGFFYHAFSRLLEDDQERLVPVGRPEWRVRFTPTEVGLYRYTLHVRTPHGTTTSALRCFSARPSEHSAFVRVCASDPRLLEMSDGTPFYPIGLNIHAPFDVRAAEMEYRKVSPDHGTFAYDRYFERLAATGANACVVWLAPWWLEIEWSRAWPGFGGLGDFNLGNAWRLDHLLAMAEHHGLRLHLVLENHGKYSLWVDSQWDSNPYNRVNGGMLDRPEAFFTSPAASAAYQRKLRYLVARYASSPALMGFELFGEMNLVGSKSQFASHPSHARWIAATARFLHKTDPYHHLLAVHYSNDWRTVDPVVAALPGLDYLVGDIYKPGGSIVDWVVETARHNGAYGKPTFSTEFGGYWNGTTPARLEADLHAGLWANFMTPAAGAPFFWWFEFVDRNDLYPHLRALAAFARGEDRRGISFTEEPPVWHAGERKVRALLLRYLDPPREASGTLAWLWVFDAAAMEVLPEERHALLISDASLHLDLPAGSYAVEYWDTYRGQIISVSDATVPSEASFTLRLPDFRRDLAVKIRHQPKKSPRRDAAEEVHK